MTPKPTTNADTRKPTRDLLADPANRRLHPSRNVEMMRASLAAVGAARSIVIDEDDVILAGNGVTAAAVAAGIENVRIVEATGDELIAVRRRGLTPEQKRALAIFDNRTAELAEWNVDQLDADQKAGLDFRPFWTAEEEAALLRRPAPGHTDPDAIPDERPTDIVRGDLFALGRHRLICADSADAAATAPILAPGTADALITSPPYNVGVRYETHDDSTMSVDAYFDWLAQLLTPWVRALKPGRAFVWNVGVSPKTAPHRHVAMLTTAGLTFVRQFVWQKVGVPVPTFHATRANPRLRSLTSNYTHEMVYVLTTGGALDVGGPQPMRVGEVLEHDVFTVNQAQATVDIPAGHQRTGVQANLDRRSMKAHPAAFPVGFVTAFLQHYAGPDELVLEPFSGAGTTIVACEQLGLACRAAELAPAYCQIAIDRWEAFTGQKAEKIAEVVNG